MTESFCGYSGDRDGALIAFLYDDVTGEPAARALFEIHLETCARCQDEIAALRGVRTELARWSPPEPSFAVTSRQSTVANPQSPVAGRPSWWREIPAWAQVAAALLFLGVSAAVANLDVRYDQNGFSVRTGWMKPTARPGLQPPVSPAPVAVAGGRGSAEPWRADLAALERQLKAELRAVQMSAATIAAHPQPVRPTADADVLRRVRALLDESEKRQQRELALRVAEVMRDVNVQRQADLVKIDRTLGAVSNNLGVEVLKNRQKMNQMDILYRASQRQ
jgi:anti-sigma factor RsiW